MRSILTCFIVLCLTAASVAATAGESSKPTLQIIPDHADGSYAAGDTVIWNLTLNGLPPGDNGPTPAYKIRSGKTELTTGTMTFSAGKTSVSFKPKNPGVFVLNVDLKAVNGPQACGVAVAWPMIRSTVPEPADFDAFWKKKRDELAAIPMNPVLEELDSGSPEIALWKITMDGIRGTKISGYLARPKAGKVLPAELQVQFWGNYPLNRNDVINYAKNGWLALNIMAHDLPCDRPKEFYTKPPISTNVNSGGDDRDKSYFLRMFLSCSRAVDYLASRSDWNKITMMVQGGSQGGFQAIATGALNPTVTLVAVSVPGGGNHAGFIDGQPCGWPNWVNSWAQGAARDALIKTSGYYDTNNFAKRITCPVLVGTGLLDSISPPETQFTMFNNLTAPKRMVLLPFDEHIADHTEFKRVMSAWVKAAAAGQPLPMK